MKTFFLLIALSAHCQIAPKDNVYICDSPTAKKYHLRNDCKGLSRCTHRIIEVTLEEAKKRKFELCKFED
jgi:5-bromo-4-chloroindolyl phosphate hydrolysis protein